MGRSEGGVRSGWCPPVLFRARSLTCQASSSCVSATFWLMARSSSRDKESRSSETRLSSSDSFRALRVTGVENGTRALGTLGHFEKGSGQRGQ